MTSHIRIPDVLPLVQAMADGAKTVFSFPFPIFKAADLEVRSNAALVSAGYTVVGEGSSTGGAVIFAAAPASGQRITIRRKQTYARTDDFLDERAPTPHELNDAVDQNVAALQELAEQVSRSVQRPLSADLSQAVDLALPAPEAGKVLGWNGSANGLVNLAQVDISDVLHKSQNLNDLPDKAQARTNLGLGSAATHAAADFATAAQGAKADSALQSSDIGVSVQAHSANLDWVAANLSAAGKALMDDADASAQRATLGLGSAATLSAGTTAGQVVQLDGTGKIPSAVLPAESGMVKVDSADSADYLENQLQAGDHIAVTKSAGKMKIDVTGLGTAATKDVGTTSLDVAAGNHTHAGVYEPVDATILRTPAIGVTVQGYDANIVKKNVANTYTAPQTPSAQALTDAATVSIAITSQVWTLTTSANRTIGAPTGGVVNTFYFLEITTNGFTPSWASVFDFGTAGAPTGLSGVCGFDIFYDGSKYRISTRFTGGA